MGGLLVQADRPLLCVMATDVPPRKRFIFSSSGKMLRVLLSRLINLFEHTGTYAACRVASCAS